MVDIVCVCVCVCVSRGGEGGIRGWVGEPQPCHSSPQEGARVSDRLFTVRARLCSTHGVDGCGCEVCVHVHTCMCPCLRVSSVPPLFCSGGGAGCPASC